jgi:hypothetical protein
MIGVLAIFLAAFAGVSNAIVTVNTYIVTMNCNPPYFTTTSFNEGECGAAIGKSFHVSCDEYGPNQHQLIVYYGQTCTVSDAGIATYNFTNGECLELLYMATGCPDSPPCASTVSEYGPWSGTCGIVYRTRTQSCTVNSTSDIPCYTCTNVSLIEHGTIDCHPAGMMIGQDYCNRTTQTCVLSKNNTAPFNILSTFFTTGPFSDGWTLLISSRTLSESVAVYNVLPILIPFNDITIASTDETSPAQLVVASHSITTSKQLVGICSMFSFTGRNVTLRDLHITIPSTCYDLIPVERGMFTHGTAMQFLNKDIRVSNVIVDGAVLGFLIDITGDVGRVTIENIDVRNTRPLPLVTRDGCWAGNIDADSGIVTVATTPNCTVTVCYGSDDLKLVVDGSEVVDMTMFLSSPYKDTNTPIRTRVHRKTNTTIIILSVLVAVIGLPVMFYLSNILIHRAGVPMSQVYTNADISKLTKKDVDLDRELNFDSYKPTAGHRPHVE